MYLNLEYLNDTFIIVLKGFLYTFIVFYFSVQKNYEYYPYRTLKVYLVTFGEQCSLHFVIHSTAYVLL